MAEALLEYIQRRAQAGRSAHEKVELALEALKEDPERRLINPRHPEHEEAMSAWNEAFEMLHDTPLLREKAEPDNKPFMPVLVRQIAEENPHHRRENARQAVAEILNPNRWKGANGKGKHPALDPASPEHEGWVEGLKVLLEWAKYRTGGQVKMDKEIGQHSTSKQGHDLSNSGQRTRFVNIDETHGTSGDVATEVDLHGRPVHRGRQGATISGPRNKE